MSPTLLPNLAYYDGTIDIIERMTIPMTDRVCWFGDGIYEATRVRNGHIYCLDDHVDRFFRSAAFVRIDLPFTKEELKALLGDLVTRVDTGETNGEAILYWQVTRAAGVPRNHIFPIGEKPKLWVTVTPKTVGDHYRSVTLLSYEDVRYAFCHVKTLNLLLNCLAADAAERAGYDECVQYRVLPDGNGGTWKRVTEGAHCNVHALIGGTLHTAPTDEWILPGIARKNLIRACHALNIPVKEEPFPLEAMMTADEVLVTSSSNFCLTATSIDGHPVGGKATPLVTALREYLIRDYLSATGG